MVILQKRVAGLSCDSLVRFVLRARRAAGLLGTADLLVTTSSVMRGLNRRFRGKDKATDVLSFPALCAAPSISGRRTSHAGDIAISADIAARNARLCRHSVAEEVKILALHGILHLAGFDHERDNGAMERKEAKLRRVLKLPVSLIERAQPAKPRRGRVARSTRARRTA